MPVKTFKIKADLEVHAHLNWHFEREAEVIITTDADIGQRTADTILKSLYPNRVPTNITVEKINGN